MKCYEIVFFLIKCHSFTNNFRLKRSCAPMDKPKTKDALHWVFLKEGLINFILPTFPQVRCWGVLTPKTPFDYTFVVKPQNTIVGRLWKILIFLGEFFFFTPNR